VEQFEESDLAPALDAVSAFVSTSVAPLTSRPEAPAGKEELVSITEGAARTGLLGEGAGLGLWEGVEDPAGIRFSLGALERVAGAGAGIAFHLHCLALGAYLGRKLGYEASQSTVVLLQGRNGFARGALAKLLSNDELEETEKALLSEFFPAIDDNGSPNILQAGDGWQSLVFPTFNKTRSLIEWLQCDRDALEVETYESSHGLDETRSQRVLLDTNTKDLEIAKISEEQSSTLYIEAVGLNAAAMIALGLGSARTALAKARAYASERRQGNKIINEHAAVRLLLGRASADLGIVAAALETVVRPPCRLSELNAVLRLRASAHPLLCRAATDLLQVFGGYGYIQDYGMEKVLRDNQHLKLSFGTPKEIQLFLGIQEQP